MKMTLKHLFLMVALLAGCLTVNAKNVWPDGTAMSEWFKHTKKVKPASLYDITEHGVVRDSTLLQTEQIQAVIDKAAANGGGTIVIPEGTFLSGSDRKSVV